MRGDGTGNGRLAVESVAFGLGYTAMLIWIGSALVASFTGHEAMPYWPAIPHLRTDTSGAISFAIAVVTLPLSKYLELGRRQRERHERDRRAASAGTGAAGTGATEPVIRPAPVLFAQAVAETAVVLATAIVGYLSFNAVTHPETLWLQLTHLLPWPTEGTVRVIALAVCLVAAAARRYLRATVARPRESAG